MTQGASSNILLGLVIVSLLGFGFAAAKVISLGGEVDSLTDKVSNLQKKLPKPVTPAPDGAKTATNADGETVVMEPGAGSDGDYAELMRQWRELSAKIDELSKRGGGGTSSVATSSGGASASGSGTGDTGTALTAQSLLAMMSAEEKATFKATVKETIEELEQEERQQRLEAGMQRLLDDLTTRLDLQPQQKEAVGNLMTQQMEAMQNLWRSGEGTSTDQRKQAMDSLMKETDEKMKGLLTTTQYATYETWRAESRGTMGGFWRGGRGPGGGGGGTQPGGGNQPR